MSSLHHVTQRVGAGGTPLPVAHLHAEIMVVYAQFTLVRMFRGLFVVVADQMSFVIMFARYEQSTVQVGNKSDRSI